MDAGYEILDKVKEIREAQEEMEETLEKIQRNQGDDDGPEILDKVNEIRTTQEEMEETLETMKDNQQDLKESVETLAVKLAEIVENQEKVFNLQNKIFQLLQQQQHKGKQ